MDSRLQTGFDFDVPLPRKVERFDGPSFDSAIEGKALTRQLDKVRDLMLDGSWRTPQEIVKAVKTGTEQPGEAAVTARLRDLRKSRFGGYTVERRRREGTRAFEYQVRKP